jgi:hypothetical protein
MYQASTSSREGSGGKRVKKGERGTVLIAEQQEKKESNKGNQALKGSLKILIPHPSLASKKSPSIVV